MKDEYHKFKPVISDKILDTITTEERIIIGGFTKIEDYVLLDCGTNNKSKITIGVRCKIKQGAALRTYDGEIEIGNRVSIGKYSILAGHGNIRIGDCTIIAGNCYISAANHIIDHEDIIRFQGETAKGINIGKNVWIGGNVSILDGVSIGDSCIVGAGSVITQNLPQNTICFGVPCKVIKTRCSAFKDYEILEE